MSRFGKSKVEKGLLRSSMSGQTQKKTKENKSKKQQSKNHTKTLKTTTNSKNRGEGPDQESPRGRRMPLNWDLVEKQTQNTSKSARSCEGVQQNTPLSSAETQDPPCQDPGDRAEKPSRHKTSSQ